MGKACPKQKDKWVWIIIKIAKMIALGFLEINNNKNSFLFESFEVQILGKKYIGPPTPSNLWHISKRSQSAS